MRIEKERDKFILVREESRECISYVKVVSLLASIIEVLSVEDLRNLSGLVAEAWTKMGGRVLFEWRKS